MKSRCGPFCLRFAGGWLALLLLARPASAVDYTVGVQDVDYFPIYASDPMGRYTGYARDLLDLFAKRSGIRLVYQVRPVKRLLSEYAAGQLDLMFPDNPRWDLAHKRGANVAYSVPAVVFQDAIMVLPARPAGPLKSLGMVRGFTPWKFKAEITAGKLHVQEAPAPKNLIDMALLGRMDGINLAAQVANYHLKAMGQPGALVPDLGLMPQQDSQYHLSSIRHPELVRLFDQFMQTDKAAVDALKLKYGL